MVEIFRGLEDHNHDIREKLCISHGSAQAQLVASTALGFFSETELYIIHAELEPLNRCWSNIIPEIEK